MVDFLSAPAPTILISFGFAEYPTMDKFRPASKAMRFASLALSILIKTLLNTRSAAASSRPSIGDLLPLHP